jgi:hypothetical protein
MMADISTKLQQIAEMPTVIQNIHESTFRGVQTLLYILQMVERGDSKETIWDVYDFLSQAPEVEKKLR